MPGGWFAMIALSFLVYRCASNNHRRRWLWILLLWLFVLGSGTIAALLAIGILHWRGFEFANEREAAEALIVPTGIGMLVGAISCVWLVTRQQDALRFSLRSLLIATTALALILGLIVYTTR